MQHITVSNTLLCPAVYCVKTNTVSTLAFLCACSAFPCRYADLHHCREAFSVIKHFLDVIGFLYNLFYEIVMHFSWLFHMSRWGIFDGNVRRWLSLVVLCPCDEESGDILIYPFPSVRPSGYRYMVCSAITSYSFWATALCRMFIHAMEVCLSTGFWFSSNILKMTTGSWTWVILFVRLDIDT